MVEKIWAVPSYQKVKDYDLNREYDRNTQWKLGVSGFMMRGVHAHQRTKASTEKRGGQKGGLWDPP